VRREKYDSAHKFRLDWRCTKFFSAGGGGGMARIRVAVVANSVAESL